jgi:hypothetical protein
MSHGSSGRRQRPPATIHARLRRLHITGVTLPARIALVFSLPASTIALNLYLPSTTMIKTLAVAVFLYAAIGSALAQQFPAKTFDWVRASDEIVQLDPADYHTGRVYRPGPDGGNMHVIIQSKQPVTLAMVVAEEWKAALLHPEGLAGLDYRCLREHVTHTVYGCHLPPSRPMALCCMTSALPTERSWRVSEQSSARAERAG